MAFEYDGPYAALGRNADYRGTEHALQRFPAANPEERMTSQDGPAKPVRYQTNSLGSIWNDITGAASGGLKLITWAPYFIIAGLVFGGVYAVVSVKKEFYDSPKEGQ